MSASWRPYESQPGSTVTGTLLVSDVIDVPELGRTTPLYAWLPEGAEDRENLSVLYMHDGENLFDDSISYSGEWKVDETLTDLGLGVVVIGIPNAGDRRRVEYCPWPNHEGDEALGEAYASFVSDTVVPFAEESLGVECTRDRRGVMGSSLGGLISIYLFVTRPSVFGYVGSLSTAAWWTPAIWDFLEDRSSPVGRVYLDVGTDEIPADPLVSEAYVDSFHRLRRWFRDSGERTSLLAVKEFGAVHHEEAWARRLPGALDFLVGSA